MWRAGTAALAACRGKRPPYGGDEKPGDVKLAKRMGLAGNYVVQRDESALWRRGMCMRRRGRWMWRDGVPGGGKAGCNSV